MEKGLDMKLTRFDYGKTPLRATNIKGEAWFVAADLCQTLGLTNTTATVARLDPDEKGVNTIYTPGGTQKVLMVSESGLYHLVFTSRKAEAKTFRRWVTMDVLPAIRKTGAYSVGQQELPLKGLNTTKPPEKRKMKPIEEVDHGAMVEGMVPLFSWVVARVDNLEKAMGVKFTRDVTEFLYD